MSDEEKVEKEEETAAEETAESAETPAADAEAGKAAGESADEAADEGAGEAEEGAAAEEDAGEAEGSEGDDGAEEGDSTTEVRQAEFQPIQAEETIASGNNLDLIMDVAVPVTIDLGGAILPLKEVLALGPGSVVKLDRPLGEPVDIKVNGELVGRGDVVVVDDQFGVQVTELNKPATTS